MFCAPEKTFISRWPLANSYTIEGQVLALDPSEEGLLETIGRI